MAEEPLEIEVSCYAGYKGEQAPRRFALGRRQVEVTEIIDRWLDPSHAYFKVRSEDGGIYILRHDTAARRWHITLYDTGARSETRLSST